LLGTEAGGVGDLLEGRLDGDAVGILMTGSLRGFVGVGILIGGPLLGLVGADVGNPLADEVA
jgi:hypothetical protein